jgi:flagellar motor switch protein FliM
MLSGSVIDNIIPKQIIDIPRISIERDAVINGIKEEIVESEIKMKSVSLSIGTLANLSPGDVVVLEHKVDTPFNLVIKDSEKQYTGYLGKCNGSYAIKLGVVVN